MNVLKNRQKTIAKIFMKLNNLFFFLIYLNIHPFKYYYCRQTLYSINSLGDFYRIQSISNISYGKIQTSIEIHYYYYISFLIYALYILNNNTKFPITKTTHDLSQGGNDFSKGGKRLVDIRTLFETGALSAGRVRTFRPGQIH